MNSFLKSLTDLPPDTTSNAFMNDVADAAREYGPASRVLTPVIGRYAYALDTLCSSQDQNTMSAIALVNHNFATMDGEAAEDELNPLLERPIGIVGDDTQKESFTSWFCQASYEDIAKFALWHQERHLQLQSRFDDVRPQITDSSLAMTKRLVDIDLFPAHALDVMHQSTAKYQRIKAIDFMEAGIDRQEAYCTSDTIAWSNRFVDPRHHIGIDLGFKNLGFHEDLHGAHFLGYGFLHGVYTPLPSSFLIEEPYVTHAAAVASDTRGDTAAKKHILHPKHRHDRVGNIYRDERAFLASLDSLSVSLLAEAAWSEPYSVFRRELEQAMTASLYSSRMTIVDIASHYAQLPSREEQGEYLSHNISAIKQRRREIRLGKVAITRRNFAQTLLSAAFQPHAPTHAALPSEDDMFLL